jgi:hypothetical protein
MPEQRRKRTEKIRRRDILTTRDKELMMTLLIRNRLLFEAFQERLTPAEFDEDDRGFSLILHVVRQFWDEHGKLPKKKLLRPLVLQAVDNDGTYEDDELDDILTLIDTAFDPVEWESPPTGQDFYKVGEKLCTRFLQERLAEEMMDTIRSNGRMVEDFPEMLLDYGHKAERISVHQRTGPTLMFEENWDETTSLTFKATRLPFIDRILGGGMVDGEAYGLLGPFGSCKTTTATMLFAEGIQACAAYETSEEFDGCRRYCVYASYEENLESIRNRLLAYCARIERSSLETMGKHGLKALSTIGALNEYEKVMYQTGLLKESKKRGKLGERERVLIAMKPLQNHGIVLDMTGRSKARLHAGGRGFPEIAQHIQMELDAREDPKGKLWMGVIDYVGELCRREMEEKEVDTDKTHNYVADSVMKCKNALGKYGCPWWLMHQMNGEANSRSTGAKMHYTDSAGSKSFARNLDFCLTASAVDMEGRVVFACDKHRRYRKIKPQIMQLIGSQNRLIGTGGKYTIHPHGGIVSTSDYNSMSDKKKGKGSKSYAAETQKLNMIDDND